MGETTRRSFTGAEGPRQELNRGAEFLKSLLLKYSNFNGFSVLKGSTLCLGGYFRRQALHEAYARFDL
jgi:hypothetical protein